MLSNSLVVLIIALVVTSLMFSWYLSGKTSQVYNTEDRNDGNENEDNDMNDYADINDDIDVDEDRVSDMVDGEEVRFDNGLKDMNEHTPNSFTTNMKMNTISEQRNTEQRNTEQRNAERQNTEQRNKHLNGGVISSIKPTVEDNEVNTQTEEVIELTHNKHSEMKTSTQEPFSFPREENDIFEKMNDSFPTLIIHEVQYQVYEPESKPLIDTNKVTEVSDKYDYNDASEESNDEGYEVGEYFGGPFKPLPIPENIKPVRETFSGTIIESEDSAEDAHKNISSEQAERQHEQLPDSNRSDRSVESESSERQTEERAYEQQTERESSERQTEERAYEQQTERESSERQTEERAYEQQTEDQPLEQPPDVQPLEQRTEDHPLEQRTESESSDHQIEQPPSQPLEQRTEEQPPSQPSKDQPPEQEHIDVRFESSSSSSYSDNGDMSNFDVVNIIDSTI